MTFNEMIAVLQAAEAEKTIQRRRCGDAGYTWQDMPLTVCSDFNFAVYHYRIKPEPRRIWLSYYPDDPSRLFFAEPSTTWKPGWKTIPFIEEIT